MPQIQWVRPYQSNNPLPPVDTDWGQITIMTVSDRGWSQARQKSFNETTGVITQEYDVQRVYSIQIDFYGPNAFDNATRFKQTLQVGLVNNFGIADLKLMSEIRNQTQLLENKAYLHRYGFDVDVFVVDTITTTTPAIETAQVTIVNRGTNN